MKKPPAFQFYAKDWNSSTTVSRMSVADRGVYITLLAAAWDSDEPGSLPLPIKIAARCARLDIRLVRNFLNKFPTCFEQINGKLKSRKLSENWLNYQKQSEMKANAAKTRWDARALHMQCPAPASAPKSIIPPTPLTGSGGNGNGKTRMEELIGDTRNAAQLKWARECEQRAEKQLERITAGKHPFDPS